jgi:hypothetical protein
MFVYFGFWQKHLVGLMCVEVNGLECLEHFIFISGGPGLACSCGGMTQVGGTTPQL